MQFLFVDESGKPSDRKFAIGGVAVHAHEWPMFRERWQAMLARHRWPAGDEIKWHRGERRTRGFTSRCQALEVKASVRGQSHHPRNRVG